MTEKQLWSEPSVLLWKMAFSAQGFNTVLLPGATASHTPGSPRRRAAAWRSLFFLLYRSEFDFGEVEIAFAVDSDSLPRFEVR